MPLLRYTIRSEFSLANPDLYRAADKDDPEGLLEGVATAGLVGIIRQLGDLAEFAAGVFHDLHEDVVAVAARGHELLVRVQQLEREVVSIESLMLTESGHGNFIYNRGMEWHPCIHNEQNHFTQGDLPGFIRSAYEDCKSPPRLFTLDRFDDTGAGACLKRYTDPSFFKLEWARSELLKAEKQQQDQKACRLKKRSHQQGNGEIEEPITNVHFQSRVPEEIEKMEMSSLPSQFSNSTNKSEQEFLDPLTEEKEDMLTASSSLFSGQDEQHWEGINVEHSAPAKSPFETLNLKQEVSDMDCKKDLGPLKAGSDSAEKEAGTGADEAASDTENFMDAETMESEAEADTETKIRAELGVKTCESMEKNEPSVKMPEIEILGRQVIYDSSREMVRDQVSLEERIEDSMEENGRDTVDKGKVFSKRDLMPEDLSKPDRVSVTENAAPPLSIQEGSLVNGHIVIPFHRKEATIPKNSIGQLLSSIKEDAAKKPKSLSMDTNSLDYVEDNKPLLSDGDLIISSQDNVVATSANVCSEVSPFILEEIPSGVDESCIASPVSEELFARGSERSDASAVSQLSPKSLSTDTSSLDFVEDNKALLSDGDHIFFSQDSVVAMSENVCSEVSPCTLEERPSGVDESCIASVVSEELRARGSEHSDTSAVSQLLPTEVNESSVLFSVLPDGGLSNMKSPPQSEGVEDLNLSQGLEANNDLESHGDPPQTYFREHQELAVSEDRNQSPNAIGTVGTRKRWQLSKLFDNVILARDMAVESSPASESERGESPQRQSVHSSPTPSIQPMRWAIGLSKFYSSDDELDELQGSIGSLSSSTSALSSPRPLILATTLEGLNLEGRQCSCSPPQKSSDSSPLSRICSPRSGITETVHEGDAFVTGPRESTMSPASSKVADSSIANSSSAVQPFVDLLPSLALNLKSHVPESVTENLSSGCMDLNNLESFPPPPPLPPLAWRMTRKSQGGVIGVSELPKEMTQNLPPQPVKTSINDPVQVRSPNAASSVSSIAGGKKIQKDAVQDTMHDIYLLGRPPSSDMHKTASLDATEYPDASEEESVPVFAPANSQKENRDNTLSEMSLQQKPPIASSSNTFSSRVLRTESTPARLGETRSKAESKSTVVDEIRSSLSRDFSEKAESKRFFTEATMSQDNDRLKRRSKWACNDREVLLEQIRSKSFSLRTSNTEKPAGSRPVININVAAILEKANAIRQAFAGSDDDEEEDVWSNA